MLTAMRDQLFSNSDPPRQSKIPETERKLPPLTVLASPDALFWAPPLTVA